MSPSETPVKVSVIGAGFSGLVSAFYLQRAGFSVDVYETRSNVGGLIDTRETDFGRIETAANGILNSRRVEELFAAAEVPLVEAGRSGKQRYIFRDGKARRWPLRVSETLGLVPRLATVKGKKPRADESIAEWGMRALGPAASRYLLAPALQGIYAGDPEALSADLILGRFFPPHPRQVSASPPHGAKGTVAAEGGMGNLLQGLYRALERNGVRFHFGVTPALADLPKPVVIATSLPAARKILGSQDLAAQAFSSVKMISLVSVHLAYPRNLRHLEGFGCLFPRGEGVRSLGVLFEESVFGDRSSDHLERWILGGVLDPEVVSQSDQELFETVRADRIALTGADLDAQGFAVTRADPAIPHYDENLRLALGSPAVLGLPARGIHLVGNYAGWLGLSGILADAEKLPARIRSSR